MKILLIYSNRERHSWPVPPPGVCYVASSIESEGLDSTAGHAVLIQGLPQFFLEKY